MDVDKWLGALAPLDVCYPPICNVLKTYVTFDLGNQKYDGIDPVPEVRGLQGARPRPVSADNSSRSPAARPKASTQT